MKCIILAGSSSEKLWPLSEELYSSNSLINSNDGKTLIQNAYETASFLTAAKNIITITNKIHYNDVSRQLNKIYSKPVIISEPMFKNSAASILTALTYLKNKKDEIVLILPFDLSLEDLSSFKTSVENAKLLAKKGYIVSFGAKPSSLSFEYNYIQTGEDLKTGKKVKKFIEKSNLMLHSAPEFSPLPKDFYWDFGIYMAKISVLLKAYENYAPKEYLCFSKEMFDSKNIKYEFYKNIPELSVDCALMEKIENLAFVQIKSKWKNYGNWQSFNNLSKKDSKNNVSIGNVILDSVKNSFIYSPQICTAVSGIKDVIIAQTQDTVLICDKSKTSDIRKLVQDIKENNENDIICKTVFKPWGNYILLNKGSNWLAKIITVSEMQKTEMHFHNYRSEHWVILEGSASVYLNDSKYLLEQKQSIDIPVKTKHSLQNNLNQPLKILEVQKGDYISEDDITFIEDNSLTIK